MKIISERCLLDQTKGKMHQMFPLYNRQNLTTIKERFSPHPPTKKWQKHLDVLLLEWMTRMVPRGGEEGAKLCL